MITKIKQDIHGQSTIAGYIFSCLKGNAARSALPGMDNRGLRMQLPVKEVENGQSVGVLACISANVTGYGYTGIYLLEIPFTGIYLRVHKCPRIMSGDLEDIRGQFKMKNILIAGTHYRQSLGHYEPRTENQLHSSSSNLLSPPNPYAVLSHTQTC
jgi:hypothetical protein